MTERELSRNAARRLAVIRHAEEVTGNVALTCRYYGVSRRTFYIWLRRFEQFGIDGLRDRSKRPLVSPNATKTEVVGKILYLIQHYHFGPAKIAMYLKRYHEVVVSPSGVWRILRRANLSRLPTSQRYKRHKERWKRYEKPQPGHALQLDVKFIEPIRGVRKKHYQYTAIDDCTRLRVLKIYDRLDQKTAIKFVDYVLEKLPFQVIKIQTDNGAEFQDSFHWHLLDRGIRPELKRRGRNVKTVAELGLKRLTDPPLLERLGHEAPDWRRCQAWTKTSIERPNGGSATSSGHPIERRV